MAKYVKGLNKDTGYVDQPDGSWRHAKNAIVDRQAGGISNEGGIERHLLLLLQGHLAAGTITSQVRERVIGKIEVSDGRVIIFTVTNNPAVNLNDFPFGDNQYSTIYEYKNEVLTSVLETWPEGVNNYLNLAQSGGATNNGIDFNLKFNINNPIEGTYKFSAEGDLLIYWTDDLNPPRALNVSRQLRTNNPKRIYNKDPQNTPNDTYVDRLNLFPHSGPVPYLDPNKEIDNVTYPSISAGGGLVSGAYQLALAYADIDGVATNYLTVSNPVYIVCANEGVRPIERYDGCPPGSQTGKSVTWIADKLNTDYEYLRPVVIQTVDNVEKAFKLKDLAIEESGTLQVTFTGLEGFESSSVEEVIIDAVAYEKAKTLTQLDGILYLGNLEGTQDVGFQPYANNIKLEAQTKTIRGFDPFEISVDNLTNGYKSTTPFQDLISQGAMSTDTISGPNYYNLENGYRSTRWNVNHKGYMRDEVYAFYIAFIMKDGSLSYAYHIPGREEVINERKFIENSTDYPLTMASWMQAHDANSCSMSNYDNLQFWDLDQGAANFGNINFQDPELYNMTNGLGRRFHFYEYSYDFWDAETRHMNYWENRSERYPDNVNFITKNILLTGQDQIIGDKDLRNEPVRHHHFPSNENQTYKAIGELNTGLAPGETSFTPTGGVRSGKFAGIHRFWSADETWMQAPTAFAVGHMPHQWVNANNFIFPDTTMFELSAGTDSMPEVGTCVFCQVGGGYGDASYDGWGGNGCNGWVYGMVVDSGQYFTSDGDWLSMGVSQGLFQPGQPLTSILGDGFYSNNILNTNNNNSLLNGRKGILLETNGGIQLNLSGSRCGCSEIPADILIEATGSEGNPCSGSPNPMNDPITGDYQCADGGLEALDTTIENPFGGHNATRWNCNASANDLTPFNPNSTQSQGNCYWLGETESVETELDEGYMSRDIKVLGFNLHDVKVPQSIADKVQGFRIYYANRGHQNRRVLGQNPVIPMERQKGLLALCGGSSSVDWFADDMDWLNTEFDTNFQLQSFTRWIKACIPREPGWYMHDNAADHADSSQHSHMTLPQDGPNPIKMCSYTGLSFHDFYLLNGHHSIAHATHLKMEYILETYGFRGIKYSLDFWTNYQINEEGQTIISQIMQMGQSVNEQIQTACARRIFYSAFQIADTFWSPHYNDDSTKMQNVSGGFLNRPIKENAKNYIRGNSYFKASSLGFGHEIDNDGGESSIVLQLVRHRGLPFLPISKEFIEFIWTGSQDLNSMDDGLEKEIPHLHEDHGFIYQTNLHAFKVDMYNTIDANELVWTGYEITGPEFRNHFVATDDIGAGTTHSTTAVYPEGIFGGDTFICRYAYRSTWQAISDSQSETQYKFKGGRSGYMTIVESTDNINFRHSGEKASGADLYAPNASLVDLIRVDQQIDLTFNAGDVNTGNIRYNEDYSKLNTLRTAIPLPTSNTDLSNFPTRIQRSTKDDGSSMLDSYRLFLANEFKDLPKDKGDLWKVTPYNNQLYFHMEDTLYQTKGKDALELKDGSEAFVGSGDIFQKDPEQIFQTYYGYGGTQSQFANIVTRHGYFFVDQMARKVFLLADKLMDLSAAGLRHWFKHNIPYGLEAFGLDVTNTTYNVDNPLSMGFTSTWDPETNRILLTKNELAPTQIFSYLSEQGNTVENVGFILPGQIRFNPDTGTFEQASFGGITWNEIPLNPEAVNGGFALNGVDTSFAAVLAEGPMDCQAEIDASGFIWTWIASLNVCVSLIQNQNLFEQKGWTVSFYPELAIWVSFHDYTPSVYMLSGEQLLSANGTADQIDIHNTTDYGTFRGVTFPFEFNFIHGENSNETKTFSSFRYHADVWNVANASLLSENATKTKIHDQGFTSFYVYTSVQNSNEQDLVYLANIRKTSNDWKVNRFRDLANLDESGPTIQVFDNIPMFIEDGMNETINPLFIDLTKPAAQQRKFVDKWIGICLKYDNISNNLLTLYSTDVEVRKYFR